MVVVADPVPVAAVSVVGVVVPPVVAVVVVEGELVDQSSALALLLPMGHSVHSD